MLVIERDSILSEDSFPEGLLAKLRDFPQVPDNIPVRTMVHPPPIVCVDGRHISGRDGPHLPRLKIDTTLERDFNELQGGEGFLDASRILRGHPGLVMEHYDPTTSVHTFKIVCPRRQQDESSRLSSSPSIPSLSPSSGNSSPLIPTLLTPLSGPFPTLRSGECLDSCTTFHSLDRAAYSPSSLATGFPKTMPLRLRHSASELSHRPPSNGHRHMSHRLHHDPPPTLSIHSSQPSSSTISSALDEPTRGSALYSAPASYKREARISPRSPSNPYLSDAPLSPDGSALSADQLLALREFLGLRAKEVSNEARSSVASSDLDPLHSGSGNLPGDVASDCSDYGGSILSGRRYSLDEWDKSTSTDGTSTSEDPWSRLSITPEIGMWNFPDSYSLLANDDTFLDTNAHPSSPTYQLESKSPQPHIDPPPQRTGSPNPASTLSINVEALPDFLPNLLDLRISVDTEGSSADARGLECEWPDVMPAQQPLITKHDLCRVRSAGELPSSHPPPTYPLPPSPDSHRGYDKGADVQAGPSELAHGQSPNPGLTVAVDSGAQSESRPSRQLFPVAKTMRRVPPALSFQTGSRYRTLEDRAYCHPDVPRSPLCSDLDNEHLVQDAFLEPSSARSRKVSSPRRVHIPHVHSPSTSSVAQPRSSTPLPPVPPQVPPKHSRNNSSDSSSSSKRLVRVHRPGPSLDSNPGSSFTIDPPPSINGVGLSLVDNGAFEAPRPAPEPRSARLEKVNTPPLRTVVQRVPVAPAVTVTEEPTSTDDVPKPDSDSVVALSLTVFSRVWPKKQKQQQQQQQSPAPQSSDGPRPRLDSTISSEWGVMSSSFINMAENENVVHVKPQRKGLLLFKRK